MTTLQKLSNLSFTPGTPYVPAFAGTPARPGYWLTNTTTVVTPVWGFADAAPYLGGSAERVYKILRYETSTVTTRVWVPPVAAVPPRPAVPASPPRTVELNMGWNGGADMAELAAADFNLSFTVPRTSIGVAIGLSDKSASGDYAAIRYGIYSSRGAVRQINAGSIGGPSVAAMAGQMSIRRSGGTITYWADGVQVGASVVETGTPLSKITAALYMAGDSVSGADFVSAASGYGATTIEPATVSGSDRSYGSSVVSCQPASVSATGRRYDGATVALQPVFVAGSNRSSGYATVQMEYATVSATGLAWSAIGQVVLEPMTSFGSDKPYAAAAVSIGPVEVEASAGRVAPSFTSGVVSTGYVLAAGHGLTGEIGQSSVSLEPVTTIAANRPYGTSSVSLLAAEVAGGNEVIPDGLALVTVPMTTLLARTHSSAGENEARIVVKAATLSAFTGAVAHLPVPTTTVVASGTAQIMARATISVPASRVVASGTVSGMASARITVPAGYAVGYGGAVASVSIAGKVSLTASAVTGGVARANIVGPMMTLPLFDVTVEDYCTAEIIVPACRVATTMHAWVVAPAARLEAIGTATVAATFEAYAVNLHHTGDADKVDVDEMTRYTNFPFTRIVRYQNSYFGVNGSGLYLLEGTTDAGAAIPYEIETHPDTFGHTGLKTVASAYLSGKIDPELTAKVVAGQDAPQTYSYTSPRGATAQTHRIKFGRGVRDRYLAVGLAGNGTLQLDEIELEINKLTRRI